MDDVVMLSPTGGTTGTPKGVMNTHRSVQTFVAHYMLAATTAKARSRSTWPPHR